MYKTKFRQRLCRNRKILPRILARFCLRSVSRIASPGVFEKLVCEMHALLRCGRLGEFLEARIVPKRIEHRIEPEQRGSERRKLSEKFSLLFRRERGDDFLEAQITAERVPERQQF